MLEEFLGIERENPKVKKLSNFAKKNLYYLDDDLLQVEPYKTGAVAPDVAKRVVGKLPKERIPIVVKNEEARVRNDNFKKKRLSLQSPQLVL